MTDQIPTEIGAPGTKIERCDTTERTGWREFRRSLWPHCPASHHAEEMAAIVAAPSLKAAFVAYEASGQPQGFIEAALRRDYVNGTTTSPVAFLEGIYVAAACRRRGIGRELVAAAEAWTISRGCTEFASDALLDNVESHAMHAALGFQETERVVFFRKGLA